MFKHTKSELAALKRFALLELIDAAGGRTHLVRMLGVNLNTVNSWVDRGAISRAGAEKVIEHQERYDSFNGEFTMEKLRPDLATKGNI